MVRTGTDETTARLDPALHQAFECHAPSVSFAAGSCLFRQGDPGHSCFLVDDGTVRVQVDEIDIDSDGVLRYVGAGQMLGELAVLDSLPRSASAYAETAVQAREFTSAKLEELSSTDPTLALGIVRSLGATASHTVRSLTDSYAKLAFRARDTLVDSLVAAAVGGQREFESWSDERVAALLTDLAMATARKARHFAERTVACTRMGDIDDKTTKNRFACLGVLGEILASTSPDDPDGHRPGVVPIPSACGVVFGVIPITSPIATAVFKILICLSGKNALILSPHRSSLPVCTEYAATVHDVLAAHGAPDGLVSWVTERSDRARTEAFMSHEKVSLVLATGGAGLVEAAYRSGTPAYGVGRGNAPALIASDANLDRAAFDVIRSKSFDNGLICGAENNLIVHRDVHDDFVAALERHGAAVLHPDEVNRFKRHCLRHGKHLAPKIIGQPASVIAERSAIERSRPIRLMVIPQGAHEARAENPFAREKMAPVVSLFTTCSDEAGTALAGELLSFDGSGHTAILHSRSDELARRYGAALPASRILVNTPASQGIFGATTGLIPSLTLGCGTFGANITTDNVNHRHVRNIKRLAFHDEDKQAMLDAMDYVNPAATVMSNMLGFVAPESTAEGCIVTDARGREYLDFLAGVGVMNVGHRHPVVVEAVKRQLDRMPFSSKLLINARQTELAKRLAILTPGHLRFSFFSNSGTEAVEAALKIARASTGRKRIIGAENSFHGKSMGALSASGREVFKRPFEPLLAGFTHVPFGSAEALEEALDDDVAAVILEPVQGEGGVVVPPSGYLQRVRELCTEHGALLILDEVQTGVGRCGTLFRCQAEAVVPDLLCLAKGLSGGVVPIGVTLGGSATWRLFEENPFLHSSTFGGNPLACAAALATLDVLENERLCERAVERGTWLLSALNDLKARHTALIADVRGVGLLIGVEFTTEDTALHIIAALAQRGVIAAYTLNQPRVIRFEPPLIVTELQCEQAVAALAGALEEVGAGACSTHRAGRAELLSRPR